MLEIEPYSSWEGMAKEFTSPPVKPNRITGEGLTRNRGPDKPPVNDKKKYKRRIKTAKQSRRRNRCKK